MLLKLSLVQIRGAGQVREWKSEVKSVGSGKMEIVESIEEYLSRKMPFILQGLMSLRFLNGIL
jgi:hypothetical protein